MICGVKVMITDSEFGFAGPRMSERQLERARLLYHAAKWLARLVLLALILIASAAVGLAKNNVGVAFPQWLIGGFLWILVSVIWSASGAFALRVLRAKGLEAALEERRIIERTQQESPLLREAELAETRTPQRRMERLALIVFFLVWAFFFAGFQWSSIGFESIEVTMGYALLAAIPALILTLCFSYFTQDPRLKGATQGATLDYKKFLAVIPWSQVARVEEVRSWNFTNSLAECDLSFQDSHGREIQHVAIPPYAADEVFEQIETRLTGRRAQSNIS